MLSAITIAYSGLSPLIIRKTTRRYFSIIHYPLGVLFVFFLLLLFYLFFFVPPCARNRTRAYSSRFYAWRRVEKFFYYLFIFFFPRNALQVKSDDIVSRDRFPNAQRSFRHVMYYDGVRAYACARIHFTHTTSYRVYEYYLRVQCAALVAGATPYARPLARGACI